MVCTKLLCYLDATPPGVLQRNDRWAVHSLPCLGWELLARTHARLSLGWVTASLSRTESHKFKNRCFVVLRGRK